LHVQSRFQWGYKGDTRSELKYIIPDSFVQWKLEALKIRYGQTTLVWAVRRMHAPFGRFKAAEFKVQGEEDIKRLYQGAASRAVPA